MSRRRHRSDRRDRRTTCVRSTMTAFDYVFPRVFAIACDARFSGVGDDGCAARAPAPARTRSSIEDTGNGMKNFFWYLSFTNERLTETRASSIDAYTRRRCPRSSRRPFCYSQTRSAPSPLGRRLSRTGPRRRPPVWVVEGVLLSLVHPVGSCSIPRTGASDRIYPSRTAREIRRAHPRIVFRATDRAIDRPSLERLWRGDSGGVWTLYSYAYLVYRFGFRLLQKCIFGCEEGRMTDGLYTYSRLFVCLRR